MISLTTATILTGGTAVMNFLYKVGRVLQFSGMILLPIAMAGEVAGKLDLKQMLMIAGSGIAVFFLGYLLQEATKPK